MKRISLSLLLVSLLGAGCDGQQYVSADTVQLLITESNVDRVNRCQYVPVLQGSRVVFRYEIEDELKATLFVTRDEVRVGFEPSDGTTEFRLTTEELAEVDPDDTSPSGAGEPPAGYEVRLRPGCKPDDEYR
jgi:hypothetical protein